MGRLLQLLNFVEPDLSWLAKFFSLLVLPFADEDFAIILGGYVVVNQLMPSFMPSASTTGRNRSGRAPHWVASALGGQ